MHSQCVLRRGPCVMRSAGVVSFVRPLRPSAAPQVSAARRKTLSGIGRSQSLHVCCALKASDLPQSLQKIVGAFQMVPDPMARYKQLLFYATKLTPLPAEDHTPANKVEGCVSQVWVKPELREDKRIYWMADSDSALTKGLAALLVTGLSGCTAEEICKLDPGFIEMLGLKQSLTPSRNNGFLNMLRLMQRKALELMAAEIKSGAGSNGHAVAEGGEAGASAASSSGPPPAAGADASSSRSPVQDGVKRKLTEALMPSKLVIVDESHKHASHAAMRGSAGGETHFALQVVSAEFEGMPLVKRHRLIYQLLQEEMSSMGLHALSLDTKAPSEVKD